MNKAVHCYQVGVRGTDWTRDVLALSRGRAKADYWREVTDAWPDVKYTDITCQVGTSKRPDEEFVHTASYRGVPFAHIGMDVQVGHWNGVIVGKNDSANFNVLFTDGKFKGQTLNCHPNYMMKYFDNDGRVIAEFGS